MMSYRYDKRKKKQQRWYLVVLLLLVIALFTPVYSGIFDLIERPLVRSWENQGKVLDGTENFFVALFGKQKILEENKSLKEKIKELEIETLRTRYLSSELQEVYQLKEQSGNDIVARVISRGVIGNRDSIVINQGSESGLGVGDQVVAYDQLLLGEVSEVYDHSARVSLLSGVGRESAAIIFPQNTQVQLLGHGNGSFLIEGSRDVEFHKGDSVYSLREPGNIIAIVRDVVFDPRDSFKKVYLSYPQNLNEIQMVRVRKVKESIQ